MDLDNIKKTWNDNLFTPSLTDDNIRHIIYKKGKTALGRLLWFEVIGLIVVLPFIAAPYIHALYLPRVPYPAFTKYFFIVCCIISFCWQIYKVQLLNKIDLKQMDILSGLKIISRYKLFIKRELFVGVAFACIILGSFCYEYIDIISDQGKVLFYLFNMAVLIIVCLIMLVFYKFFYKKNIESIESSLKEVKEMETDS
ncbi:hypothetical protein G7050_06275 [Dysgonomonas sp. HDW5A]|uniref:hypothetical protein n=1 Tax=Dysgonomonas sp. HDW5A TaxID=2714926 RepID=UPI00140E4D79|nr:hypothetical protein [Dysgonomonas sp. HDW5A]QIK59457.1 hypothetical protein G7050_06275 [Dysgonomonas sp. HDW5A]